MPPPPPHQGTFNHRFKIIGPLFAAFASALSLTACPSPGGTPTGGAGGTTPAKTAYTTTVTGTVQDASRTGLGLPGATVSASTAPTATTTTGSDGTFRLQVTHSGSFTLTIADCVRIVTPGEFASAPLSRSATITSNTRLAGRLGTSPAGRVTAIELPDTLRVIEDYAFHQHLEVTGEFTIPAAVEPIGIRAFEEAFTSAAGSSLSNFVIPENVTSVGNNAFGSTVFSGTLTIRSPHLTRTPATGTRTGKLGSSIFTQSRFPITQEFTKIVIPRAVFTSCTQTDLNAIFGPGGNYVDLADGTTALTP